MKLRTPIATLQPDRKINLTAPILTIGSCFSDSIGQKLIDNKFDAFVNPFGTLFDPLSITRILSYSLSNQLPAANTYVQSEGVYKNLELHSSFTGLSKDELQLKINAQLTTTNDFLRTTKWLMVTLGTAFAYQLNDTEQFIANCQKLPAKNFTKKLKSVEELKHDFMNFIELLLAANPSINIMLTVSPVRHLKDGIAENSISKAVLRLLCYELEMQNESVYYYPAYEIMMDDLRDYRFYNEDMIHPSNQAIEYIWHHFSNSFFNTKTLYFLEIWKKIQNSINHRAYNPTTKKHQQFLKKTLQALINIKDTVNVEKEIARIKEQILPSAQA